jgi:hypothetical protein
MRDGQRQLCDCIQVAPAADEVHGREITAQEPQKLHRVAFHSHGRLAVHFNRAIVPFRRAGLWPACYRRVALRYALTACPVAGSYATLCVVSRAGSMVAGASTLMKAVRLPIARF